MSKIAGAAAAVSAWPPWPRPISSAPSWALNCQASTRRSRVVPSAPAALANSASSPNSVNTSRQPGGTPTL
ncbi:MAG: hypothetical protein U0Z44_16385 [Kouleothrix sp.]